MQTGLVSFVGESCLAGALRWDCILLLLCLCWAAHPIQAHPCLLCAGCWWRAWVGGCCFVHEQYQPETPHLQLSCKPTTAHLLPWTTNSSCPELCPPVQHQHLLRRTRDRDLQGAWHPLSDAWLFLLLEGSDGFKRRQTNLVSPQTGVLPCRTLRACLTPPLEGPGLPGLEATSPAPWHNCSLGWLSTLCQLAWGGSS